MKRMKGIMSAGIPIALGLAGLALVDAGGSYAKNEATVQDQAKSEYVVKEGDTLSSIALKLSGRENDWILIARENGLANIGKSQRLEAGKRLKIPAELHES